MILNLSDFCTSLTVSALNEARDLLVSFLWSGTGPLPFDGYHNDRSLVSKSTMLLLLCVWHSSRARGGHSAAHFVMAFALPFLIV